MRLARILQLNYRKILWDSINLFRMTLKYYKTKNSNKIHNLFFNLTAKKLKV